MSAHFFVRQSISNARTAEKIFGKKVGDFIKKKFKLKFKVNFIDLKIIF